MTQENMLAEIKKSIVPLLVSKFNSQSVFLFGSVASGYFTKNSDVDLIVVSEYFKSVPVLKRMPLILNALRYKKHLDILCYTTEEFERVKETSAVLKEALKTSVRLV